VIAHIRELNGESAAIAESVEGAAMGILPSGAMILLLIQIASGLLAGVQGNFDLFAVLEYHNGRRRGFSDRMPFKRQSFQFADLAIIAKDQRPRLIAFLKKRNKQGLQPVNGLSKTLKNKILSIAIDDKTRKEVRFGIDATANHGIDAHAGSEIVGFLKAAAEKLLADRSVAPRQESKRDLGPRAVESLPKDMIAFVPDGGDSAGRDIRGLPYIAPINPEMAVPDPGGAAVSDTNLAFFHRWHLWHRRNLHAYF
jgi:hypothetical protein